MELLPACFRVPDDAFALECVHSASLLLSQHRSADDIVLDITGSDITNCLTHAIAFNTA